MKAVQDLNIPHPQPEAGQILSIVHGQPLTTLEHMLNEQMFLLKAASFLNEVQLCQEFWDTRPDPVQDQGNLGLAMAALQLLLEQITEQAQHLDMRQWKRG